MSARRKNQKEDVESTSSEDSRRTPEFYVEAVIGVKFDKNQLLYNTKWVGWVETTWEPEENFEGEWAMETLLKYKEDHKERIDSILLANKNATKPQKTLPKTPAKLPAKTPSKNVSRTVEKPVTARNIRALSEASTVVNLGRTPGKPIDHKEKSAEQPKARGRPPKKTILDGLENEEIERKTPTKTPRKRRAQTEGLLDGPQSREPSETPGRRKSTRNPVATETNDLVETAPPKKRLVLTEEEERECQNSLGSSRNIRQAHIIRPIRINKAPDVTIETPKDANEEKRMEEGQKTRKGKEEWEIHSAGTCMKCVFHEKEAKEGEKCEFAICDCETCKSLDASRLLRKRLQEEVENEEEDEPRFEDHHIKSCKKTCRKCTYHGKTPGNPLCPYYECKCKHCERIDKANKQRFQNRLKKAKEAGEQMRSSFGPSPQRKSRSKTPDERSSGPNGMVTQRKKNTREQIERAAAVAEEISRDDPEISNPVATEDTPVTNPETIPSSTESANPNMNTPARNVEKASENPEGRTVLDHLTDTVEDPQTRRFLQRSAEKKRSRSKTPSAPISEKIMELTPVTEKIMELLNAATAAQAALGETKEKPPQKRSHKKTAAPLPKVPPLPQKKTKIPNAPEVAPRLQNVNPAVQVPPANNLVRDLPAEQNPNVRQFAAPEVRQIAPVVPRTQKPQAVVVHKENVPIDPSKLDIESFNPVNFYDRIFKMTPQSQKAVVTSILIDAMKKGDSQMTRLSIHNGANMGILIEYFRERPFGRLSNTYSWLMEDVKVTLRKARDVFYKKESLRETFEKNSVFTFPMESKEPFHFKCKRVKGSENPKSHVYLVFHQCALFGLHFSEWKADCSVALEMEAPPVLNGKELPQYVTRRNEKSAFFRIPRNDDDNQGDRLQFTIYPPKHLREHEVLAMQLVQVEVKSS